MRPKKSLGQNFLTNKKIAEDIVKAGNISKKDIVLEIGPGKGMLTEFLLKQAKRVIAVEKDNELFSFLSKKFTAEISSNKLILISGDILDFDFSSYELKNNSYKLIANIPYNITGQLFRLFLETGPQPKTIVLMIQKEVAERIIARNKKESVLSVSVKTYGIPKIARRVSAGSFFPKPNVDSAVLAVENIKSPFKNRPEEKKFFELLKAGFSSKRKKLSSNLSAVIPKNEILKIFTKLGLNENTRAEDVSAETFLKIAEEIKIKIF
jgi:16S rRNA (adenine1518-N6/adenine1519-N6)-dimethyltransferase